MKYYSPFQRYLGRSLLKHERRIIAALEYYRQHKTMRRVLIVDPPGYDSRELLCQYIRFVHDVRKPTLWAMVMARTRRDALKASGYRKARDGDWLFTATGIKPDNIRGRTYNYALLLDADRYRPLNSDDAIARKNFGKALAAVAPVILNEGENFIIIHVRGGDMRIPAIYDTDPDRPHPVILHPEATAGQIALMIIPPRDGPPQEIILPTQNDSPNQPKR